MADVGGTVSRGVVMGGGRVQNLLTEQGRGWVFLNQEGSIWGGRTPRASGKNGGSPTAQPYSTQTNILQPYLTLPNHKQPHPTLPTATTRYHLKTWYHDFDLFLTHGGDFLEGLVHTRGYFFWSVWWCFLLSSWGGQERDRVLFIPFLDPFIGKGKCSI